MCLNEKKSERTEKKERKKKCECVGQCMNKATALVPGKDVKLRPRLSQRRHMNKRIQKEDTAVLDMTWSCKL